MKLYKIVIWKSETAMGLNRWVEAHFYYMGAKNKKDARQKATFRPGTNEVAFRPGLNGAEFAIQIIEIGEILEPKK